LFSAWYKKQTEGQAIHSPDVCLPAGGWEVFSITPTEITIPNTVYGTFNVNRAIIQKGSQRQLVYYWFEQRGERMTNDFLVKISVMRDTFTRGRGDGAIVRLVMPLAKDADEAEADKRLQAFMQDVLEHMPRYIPE
jgi:EpsI family protein